MLLITERTQVSPGGWLIGVGGTMGAGLLGIAAVQQPLVALALCGAVAVAWATYRRPEIPLAVGSFATLAGGGFSIGAQIGQAILLVAGAVAVLELLRDHRASTLRLVALPAFTALWLGLRLAMESGVPVARPTVACLAAVVLGGLCIARRRPWVTTWAAASVVFLGVTAVFGQLDPTGSRFEGISGNPNRMVFGALVALPVLMDCLFHGKSLVLRLAMTVGIVVAVRTVLVSGSDQGVVGLGLVMLLLVAYLVRRADSALVGVAVLASAAVAVYTVLGSGVLQGLSPDLRSLSGRTYLYQAGWAEFTTHPVWGSGAMHISSGLAADRATHNSLLGFANASGIVGAAAWLALLLRSGFESIRRLHGGELAAAMAVVVILVQLVQSVELSPLAWAALLLGGSRLLERDAREDT